MSRNALATLGAALLVLLALPAIGAAKNPHSALNGVYRVQYTENELVALGTSAKYAKQNYGVDTLWLANGRYRVRQSRYPAACVGSYTVNGNRVTFDLNVPHCNGIVVAAWALSSGSLRFRVIRATDPGDVQLWGSKPWKKIG